MNCDIPYLRCWVRLPFVSKQEGMEEAYAFGISSIPGRALAFHCMLRSGAHYRHVPIHALALRPDAEPVALGDCQLWDCFTFNAEVHVYSCLREHEAIAYRRSGPAEGTYLFTLDWLPDSWAQPGFVMHPDQNKCGHVLALDNGNLCCLPTNRIAWRDAYFIGRNPDPRSMGYTVQEEVYQAEDSAFDVSGSQHLFYGPERCSGVQEAAQADRPPERTPGPLVTTCGN